MKKFCYKCCFWVKYEMPSKRLLKKHKCKFKTSFLTPRQPFVHVAVKCFLALCIFSFYLFVVGAIGSNKFSKLLRQMLHLTLTFMKIFLLLLSIWLVCFSLVLFTPKERNVRHNPRGFHVLTLFTFLGCW